MSNFNNIIMDRKFLSPDEMIASREKKIADFIAQEVKNQTIYGWQLIIRKATGDTMADCRYLWGLERFVNRLTGDNKEVLLDSGQLAFKVFTQQHRYEAIGDTKVYFDCGVAQCSREAHHLVGTKLNLAINNALLIGNHQGEQIAAILKHECNITYIGDLLCFSREDIAKIKGLGSKRMQCLDKTLAHYRTAWGALKRPRKLMRGSIIIELQVIVKAKEL